MRCLPFTLLLISAGLGAGIGAASSFADEEPQRLRVLSYNIHHAEGTDGKLDLERIARIIRSAEPDLVALQEVDRGTERTGRVDQPVELQRLTQLTAIFGPNIGFQGGEYGNAVLSRLPIQSHTNHLLPNFDEGEQRGVLEVVVEGPAGSGPLLFLATHLDHRRDDRERLASVTRLNRIVAAREGTPALLAGDLNAVPDSRVLEGLAETWQVAEGDSPGLTSPASKPVRQIDYVLLRPSERWEVEEVRVLEEPVASDHRPILAVLRLVPGT